MKHYILFSLVISLFLVATTGEILAQETVNLTNQVEINKQKVEAFSYACLYHKGSYEDHEMVISKFIGAINAQSITPMGPLFGIYYNSPMDTKPEDLIWEIGFQVADSIEVSEPLVIKKWEFTTVVNAMHIGPYEQVAETYPAIFQWIGEMELIPAGPVMERFLSDPEEVKPEELKSEVWVPVKKVRANKAVPKKEE